MKSDQRQAYFLPATIRIPATAMRKGYKSKDLYREGSAGEAAMALGAEVVAGACSGENGMDPKTARKYLRDRRLPSKMRQKHTWRTRPDPFADSGERVDICSPSQPTLQANTVFQHLQEAHRAGSVTGKYGHCGAESVIDERPKGRRERDGATLQNRFKNWY